VRYGHRPTINELQKVYDNAGFIKRKCRKLKRRLGRLANNDRWITLENGSRVLLDDDGNIKGGLGGKYTGKKLGRAFGKNPTDTPQKRIATAEKSIAYNDYETAIIFDKDGNELARIKGEKQSVNLSGYTGSLRGTILTHNHPYIEQMEQFGFEQTSILSPKDIMTSYENGISETRMVIGNETHIFKWNEGTSKYQAQQFADFVEETTDKANKTINQQMTRAQNKINRGEDVVKVATAMYSSRVKAIQSANRVFEYQNNQEVFGFTYRKMSLEV